MIFYSKLSKYSGCCAINLPAISVEVETDMEETAGSADAGAVSAPLAEDGPDEKIIAIIIIRASHVRCHIGR